MREVRCSRRGRGDPGVFGLPVPLVRHAVAAGLAAAMLACAPQRPVAPRPAPASEPSAVRDDTASIAAGLAAVPPMPVTPMDSARAALGLRRLHVPVAGADIRRIPSSFSAPRGGRVHGAIDIMAPRGTPVLSADTGSILRVSENRAGGLTIYAVDPGRKLVYYYAHLDAYANGVAPGRTLARGDTLGFVGTTGNAPRDIPHLHFQVMLMHPEGRYWAGTPVDPLPLLRAATDSTHAPDE